MTPGLVTVPERDAYWLANASVPATLLADLPPGVPVDADGLARVDVAIRDGRIVAVVPAGGADGPEPRVDLARGQLWPCLIDVHTHLDKAHTCERAPNPDGTFASALRTVAADRSTRWSAEDVRRRIDFGLRCSWAHGTRAIRTHIDSMGPQAGISWPVFDQVRKEWAGRIDLQAVSLIPIPAFGGPEGVELADRVAAAGGILGAVAYILPQVANLVDRLLDPAAQRRLH